jgi:hypothetical protein
MDALHAIDLVERDEDEISCSVYYTLDLEGVAVRIFVHDELAPRRYFDVDVPRGCSLYHLESLLRAAIHEGRASEPCEPSPGAAIVVTH